MSLSDYMTKCTQTASSHRHFKLPEVKFISISDRNTCGPCVACTSSCCSATAFLWRLFCDGKLVCCWLAAQHYESDESSYPWLCLSISASHVRPETPFLSSHGGVGGNQLHIGFFQPSLLKSSSFLQASESNFPQLFEVRISQGWLSTAPQWEQPGPSQLSAGDKDPLSRRRLCRLICPAPLGNGAAVWLWSAWDSGQ